ncbi:hypothetical protein, partial [Thermodesulfatator atlanticus]
NRESRRLIYPPARLPLSLLSRGSLAAAIQFSKISHLKASLNIITHKNTRQALACECLILTCLDTKERAAFRQNYILISRNFPVKLS